MRVCKVFLLLSTLLSISSVGYFYYKLKQIPPLPNIDADIWWGPGAQKKMDTSIRPFKIEFKEEMITNLKYRLTNTTPFEPLEGIAFEYGFNNNYLKEVLKFWAKDYNFKEREAFLNKFPQFKTNIQGLDIHYIHVKPTLGKDVKVVPLLLMHGWPGSVREFYEAIPLLTTPRKDYDFVFEVIVPSLPGFGFSQASAKPGMGVDHMAVTMRNLMHRLGFKKYYLQGGDVGCVLSTNIAMFFPEEVLGLHINPPMIMTPLSMFKWMFGIVFQSMIVEEKYADRMYPFMDHILYLVEESGYAHIQATKPDTVGVALRDSPAGLAAYILEKFSTWTNKGFKNLPDGGLTKKFKLVDLLDNVMIYWTTGSITSSLRTYAETLNKRVDELKLDLQLITVPSAVANFKHELTYQPEHTVKERFTDLVHFSHFDDGGHFAAFELPEIFVDDVWIAFSKMRKIEKKKMDKTDL